MYFTFSFIEKLFQFFIYRKKFWRNYTTFSFIEKLFYFFIYRKKFWKRIIPRFQL